MRAASSRYRYRPRPEDGVLDVHFPIRLPCTQGTGASGILKWQQHLILFLVAVVVGTGAAFVTVDLLFPEEEAAISAQDPTQPYNVVLISIDTLRPDHLQVYGYPRETSPEIDAFFGDSEIWKNAYAPEASTAPSVVSLLTGRLPQNHGVRLFYRRLGKNVPTLADILKTNGYDTGAVVSNIVLTAEAIGLDERFDHYDDFVDEREGIRKVWERRASRTTDAALDWLGKRAPTDAPHFLWVHYIDPHGPYRSPPDKPRSFSHEGRQEVPLWRIPGYTRLEEDPTDGLRYVDRYDEEIAYMDREVGRLLDQYEADGLVDNTIFIFTADHGETMTDADRYFTHGYDTLEPVMRVPLFVRRPGQPESVSTEPVSTMDIAPSVLDWLDLPVPAEMDGFPLQDRPPEAPVSLEATSHRKQIRAIISGGRKWTIRRDDQGNVQSRKMGQLVDPDSPLAETIVAEPEAEDWIDTPATEVMEHWMRDDPYPKNLSQPGSAAQRISGPKVAPGRSQEQIEALRALGYVE